MQSFQCYVPRTTSAILIALALISCHLASNVAAAPIINQVTPLSAGPGMPFVIEGSGFSVTPTKNLVSVGGQPCELLRPTSHNVIVALVPVGAVTGAVELTVDSLGSVIGPILTVTADPGYVNSMEVVGNAGIQPLDYSVIRTLLPQITITLDGAIPSINTFQVFLTSSGALSAADLSGSFVLSGLPPSATASISAPLSVNTLVGIVNDSISFSGTMVNYDATTIGLGGEFNPDDTSTVVDPAGGLLYDLSFLEIGFDTLTSEAVVQQLLETSQLVPVGYFQDLTLSPPLLSVITDTYRRPETPVLLSPILEADPAVTYASVSHLAENNATTTEKLPQRLISGGAYPRYGLGTTNDGFDSDKGGFDHDGTVSGSVHVDELDLIWRHFFYQTFAGHRLRDYIITNVTHAGEVEPTIPILAILDAGFGNGKATAAENRTLNDLPLSRLGSTDGDGHSFHGIEARGGKITKGPPKKNEDRKPIEDLKDEKKKRAHGTNVALLAAGNGAQILGTGPNLRVIPYKSRGQKSYMEALRDMITRHKKIKVINISSTFGKHVDHTTAKDESKDYVPRFKKLMEQGQILILAGGNSPSFLSGEQEPQALTDKRGAVTPVYPLLMNVAATDIPDYYASGDGPLGPEQVWDKSSKGERIAVCANGGLRMTVVKRGGKMRATGGGSSWAAPQVAGLAGELIYLDEWLRGVPAAGDALRKRRLQVVEWIKGTADDLGTSSPNAPRLNNNAGDGPDDRFGYGRIHVWKAILSVANGGLSAQHGRPATGDDATFKSLKIITDSNTKWYGFEIATSEKLADVYVDGVKLSDSGDNLPTGVEVSTYKGVRSSNRIERGVHNKSDGSIDDTDKKIVEEDPTLGIVAVGTRVDNRGQYMTTFSIERKDIYKNGKPRTLSLKVRGAPGEKHKPFFNLVLTTAEMRTGKVSGVTFDDFVYQVVVPDYGDADIGPTKLSENGARHQNSALEWFGRLNKGNLESVTAEHNAEHETSGGDARVDVDGKTNRVPGKFHNRDGRDDGFVLFPLTYKTGTPGKVQFSIGVFDVENRRYAADKDKSLWVNLWIDWDTDGVWKEENKEHVIDGLQINPRGDGVTFWEIVDPGEGGATTVQLFSGLDGNSAEFESAIPVGTVGKGKLWARARLDYGENVGRNDPRPHFRSLRSLRKENVAPNDIQTFGQKRGYMYGAARYGEVEDYLIGTDFGDAADASCSDGIAPLPNTYPTCLANDGARHLLATKEWLGSDDDTQGGATREIDANDRNPPGSDADGDPNLFPEQTDRKDNGVYIPPITAGSTIDIEVTATASIGAYGGFIIEPGDDESSVSDPEDEGDLMPRYGEGGPGFDHRLFLSGWADWNGNSIWEPAEKIIDDVRNPVNWGPDGFYTLGETFDDENGNGVHEDSESFTDSFGKETETINYSVQAPPQISPRFSMRFRLAYGEDESETLDLGVKEADETNRANNEEKGGALFGEVEDYLIVNGISVGDTFSTAVSGLQGLNAIAGKEQIEVRWIVSSSDEYVGFNILRAVESGQFDQVNPDLISNNAPSHPHTFSWIDEGVIPEIEYWYRIEVTLPDGSVEAISQIVSATASGSYPARFALRIIGPAPIRVSRGIEIAFDVPRSGGDVSVELYNIGGRRVATLMSGSAGPGTHVRSLSASSLDRLASGIYFLKMDAGVFSETKRVVLVR